MCNVSSMLIMLLMFCAHSAAAESEFENLAALKSRIAAVYKIEKGLFSIDLNGDDTPDMVVTGHRNHFNAHDFYVHSFYIAAPDGELESIELNAPARDPQKAEFVIYTIPFDGECIVSELRFIRLNGTKELILIKTYRQIETSYGDPARTFVDLYQLTYDDEEDRYLYIKTQTLETAVPHVSAIEAFQELGIQ